MSLYYSQTIPMLRFTVTRFIAAHYLRYGKKRKQ